MFLFPQQGLVTSEDTQAGQSIGPLTIDNPGCSGWAKRNEFPQRLKPRLLQPLMRAKARTLQKREFFLSLRRRGMRAHFP